VGNGHAAAARLRDTQTDTQTCVTTIHFSWSTTHAKCNDCLPGEPVLAQFSSSTCLRREPLVISCRCCVYKPDVLLIIQPTVSKYWMKHKALTAVSGRASSFITSSVLPELEETLLAGQHQLCTWLILTSGQTNLTTGRIATTRLSGIR